jgi:sugar phosphate isomerase/epimerase
MTSERPILISIIQYVPKLEAGSFTVLDLVNKAHELGADGVELRREPWPDFPNGLAEVRERIQELGLRVTFGTFSTLFNQSDEAHRLLLQDIETAHALGSPLLRVFPGATPADDDAAGWAQGREAVEHAAAVGIRLALENYARTPGGTLAEVANILARIESPALRANIDTGNYPLHNQDVLEAIHAIGHKAIYVHIKDYAGSPEAPSPALGEGVLPLAEIFAALDSLPQQIHYCFEFPGGPDPDQRIANALHFMRTIRGQTA